MRINAESFQEGPVISASTREETKLAPAWILQHGTESSSAGLYTDIHGQVMHLRGHAIPNLYAGGTVRVRTEYGAGYQAGLTLLGGMTFGRIAVEHALLGNKKPG